MMGKNVTRVELMEAVCQKLGLSRAESTEIVQQLLEKICATLVAGEAVKLSGFGTSTVREKGRAGGEQTDEGCRGANRTAARHHLQSLASSQGPHQRWPVIVKGGATLC